MLRYEHTTARRKQSGLNAMTEFTREEKLKELAREIALRRNVYAKRVNVGQMTREQADKQIAIMIEIAKDYGGTG